MPLLALPVRLHRGHIGSITLEIPLTKLREKPVVVTVEDVYLQLLPRYGSGSSLGLLAELVRGQRLKRELRTLLRDAGAADIERQQLSTTLVEERRRRERAEEEALQRVAALEFKVKHLAHLARCKSLRAGESRRIVT
jgi:hypothetical protein